MTIKTVKSWSKRTNFGHKL